MTDINKLYKDYLNESHEAALQAVYDAGARSDNVGFGEESEQDEQTNAEISGLRASISAKDAEIVQLTEELSIAKLAFQSKVEELDACTAQVAQLTAAAANKE